MISMMISAQIVMIGSENEHARPPSGHGFMSPMLRSL